LLTGLIAGWQSYQRKQNIASTALMLETNTDGEDAAALIGAIPAMQPPHRALSHMTAAGILIERGNAGDALAQYKQAAADKSAPAVLRDLARLMGARLEWSMSDEADKSEKADALLADLAPLLNDKKNPWQAQALMQAALITANGKH